MKFLRAFFLATVLLVAAVPTSAQTAQDYKKMYDTNGNGVLDQNEIENLQKAINQKVDTNGDGTISDQEMEQAKQAIQQKVLATYDKDGDGKLSDAERQAARESLKAKRGGRRHR